MVFGLAGRSRKRASSTFVDARNWPVESMRIGSGDRSKAGFPINPHRREAAHPRKPRARCEPPSVLPGGRIRRREGIDPVASRSRGSRWWPRVALQGSRSAQTSRGGMSKGARASSRLSGRGRPGVREVPAGMPMVSKDGGVALAGRKA